MTQPKTVAEGREVTRACLQSLIDLTPQAPSP